jgi:hypothetical protein
MRNNLFTVNEQISKISIQKIFQTNEEKVKLLSPMPGIPGPI